MTLEQMIQRQQELLDTAKAANREFTAEELQKVQYANASLYCFDVNAILAALETCKADNAQGEIYLTDTLEYFAARNEARIFEIPRLEDMLTFSTKDELKEISRFFEEL